MEGKGCEILFSLSLNRQTELETERGRERELSDSLFLSQKVIDLTSSSSTRARQAWAVASSMEEAKIGGVFFL
jgi:hypothetical protein